MLDEKIKTDLNAKGIEGWNYSIAKLEISD
jgi:hypothetical protein